MSFSPNIACAASAISTPLLPNADIVSLSATLVQNYTASSQPFSNPNHGPIPPVTLNFCNITITHTRPGHDDKVLTQVWLPTTTWNGRLQAIGGGGFIAGLFGYMFIAMDAALAEGYATVSSNAGIYATDINGGDAHTWALFPNSSVNYFMLENFAYRSLGDMTVLANHVIKSYYGTDAQKRYFSGCSNGGRQGYALAQRYPGYFDGIAACAPAIFWDEFVEMFAAHQLMDEKGVYPLPCEFDALRAAAIRACDGSDGTEDGILAEEDKCNFNPFSIVGEEIECSTTGTQVRISKVAAEIAKGHWTGNVQEGVNFQSQTGGHEVDLKHLARTTCSNGICVGEPSLIVNWLKTFIKKDLKWNPSNVTKEEFEKLREQSVREYGHIMGITGYDLSEFRDAGGKLITYHGTADADVPYRNTRRFYDAIAKSDSSIHDYYRLFLAPGLGHGIGGKGAYPHPTFHSLVDWVENGKAPDFMEATSQPDTNGNAINRILCAYPKKAKHDGKGDTNDFGSYTCVD